MMGVAGGVATTLGIMSAPLTTYLQVGVSLCVRESGGPRGEGGGMKGGGVGTRHR